MLNKIKLIEQLESLSEQFSKVNLVERLILIEKIETGMLQSAKSEVIS